MKPLGPLLGIGLTIDRDLLYIVLAVNLMAAVLFVGVLFRRRRAIERLLLICGVFLLLTLVSGAGMHLFARTPLRDVQVFLVD